MSETTIARPLHAQLLYHVLAHLDLGADAASLYDADLPLRPWVPGLRRAYQQAPDRLAVHGLPLVADHLQGLMERLARREPDPDQALLQDRLAAALYAERDRVERHLEETAAAARTRADEMTGYLREPLCQLRRALWADGAGPVPDLRILDCDALMAPGGTRGRAATHRGQQVTAVSLAAPREQVLCQLLHEEIHAASDAEVLEQDAGARDTRAGSQGFDLHRRLEQAAVLRGQALIDAETPRLRAAYGRWRKRHGC